MRGSVAFVIVTSGRSSVSPSTKASSATQTLPWRSVNPSVAPALIRRGTTDLVSDAGIAGVIGAGLATAGVVEAAGFSEAGWQPVNSSTMTAAMKREFKE